ncbi:MAG: hypothetical protein ACOX4F_01735 [Atopobiaceae bacterium]
MARPTTFEQCLLVWLLCAACIQEEDCILEIMSTVDRQLPRQVPIVQSATFKYDMSDAMGRLFEYVKTGLLRGQLLMNKKPLHCAVGVRDSADEAAHDAVARCPR